MCRNLRSAYGKVQTSTGAYCCDRVQNEGDYITAHEWPNRTMTKSNSPRTGSPVQCYHTRQGRIHRRLTQLIIPANCMVLIRLQQGVDMVCKDTSAGNVERVQLSLEMTSHLKNNHRHRNSHTSTCGSDTIWFPQVQCPRSMVSSQYRVLAVRCPRSTVSSQYSVLTVQCPRSTVSSQYSVLAV